MKTIQASNFKNIDLKYFYKNLFDNNLGYFKNPYLLQDKDNKKLFFNAITSEYCCLTDKELFYFNHNKICPELINNIFYLTNNLKKSLPLIVNNVYKEIVQTIIKNSKDALEIVILTTTGCNAACFYCYEGNLTKENIHFMDINTADKIINFIKKYYSDKKININIRWFGGEPLLNKNIISYICNKLYSLNIKFFSTMVSNALLFNEKMIAEMKQNQWNLKQIQITLDGTENNHNKIKNFKNIKINAFQTILHNILLLAQEKIKINIRLNVSAYNKDDLINLIEYLNDNHYLDNSYISIYCATLFNELGDEKNNSCNTDILKQQLLNNFKEIVQHLNKYHYQLLSKDPSAIGCKASLGEYLIILPDGSISSCEHYNGVLPIMNIQNFNLEILKEYSINKNSLLYKDITKDKCQKCWNYPFCNFVFACRARDGFCNQYVNEKQKFLILSNLRYLYRNEIDN